ncbi:reverse transcriptase domain-containing protein [Tanacetum coccineum]
MGPFPSSNENKFILVVIYYVSKWVEAQAFPTSDARNVINELDDLRLDAYKSYISYKERTKKWHDKHIKTPINYEKRDKVLLFNSRLRLFPGKLKSRWYRPFPISKDMKSLEADDDVILDDEGGDLRAENISKKMNVKIFTVSGDGIKIFPDGVIFDKKKLWSS